MECNLLYILILNKHENNYIIGGSTFITGNKEEKSTQFRKMKPINRDRFSISVW